MPLRRASKIAAKRAARQYRLEDVGNNATLYIENLVAAGSTAEAHLLIKAKIEEYFQGPTGRRSRSSVPPARAGAVLDDLLIPKDHPRLPSDTYYVSRPGGREVSASTDVLLRTHTSAHQSQLLRDGEAFLCTGDVYRRDEIDASHFPAFHQMEGVKLFPPADVGGAMTREEWLASPGCELIAKDLKKTLEGLCDHLFATARSGGSTSAASAARATPPPAPHPPDLPPPPPPPPRPSPPSPPPPVSAHRAVFELEIYYNGDWMEVLGCGVVHRACSRTSASPTATAGPSASASSGSPWCSSRSPTYARDSAATRRNSGARQPGAIRRDLGSPARALPLLADPALLTDDTRFSKQFKPGQLTTFKPYSKYPPCFKDIAFWIPDGFEPNDFFELGRAVAGEFVEKVDLIDEFTNPKKAKTSHCYRITYRSMDRSPPTTR